MHYFNTQNLTCLCLTQATSSLMHSVINVLQEACSGFSLCSSQYPGMICVTSIYMMKL